MRVDWTEARVDVDAVAQVFDREGALDSLHIRVERAPDVDAAQDTAALEREIVQAMRTSLLIGATVTIEAAGSLPRSEGGKLSRTIDRRTL